MQIWVSIQMFWRWEVGVFRVAFVSLCTFYAYMCVVSCLCAYTFILLLHFAGPFEARSVEEVGI